MIDANKADFIGGNIMPQTVDVRTGRVRCMTASEYFDACDERIRHFRELLSKENSPNGTTGIWGVIRRWEEERDRALGCMIDGFRNGNPLVHRIPLQAKRLHSEIA